MHVDEGTSIRMYCIIVTPLSFSISCSSRVSISFDFYHISLVVFD